MNDEEIKAAVAKRVAAEASQNPLEDAGKAVEEPSLEFVRRCYYSNEVGDAILYNHLNRNKFVFNVVSGRWYVYVAPHWEVDLTDRALAAIEETVVPQYLRLVADLDQRIRKIAAEEDKEKAIKALRKRKAAVLKRIDRLRAVAGRKNCMVCAHSNADPLTVHERDLDQHPWLLACPNTVVDLRSGESRPGNPADWITKTCNAEWQGLDVDCPQFKQFLLEAVGDNKEVFDFMGRLLGCAITGTNHERIFIILVSRFGQGGKGTLMEILYEVLGSFAGPVQSEMLMTSRSAKLSAAPSPDIIALKGRRIVWASENEENQRFATGKIKWLTGGDPLTGRGINDKDFTTFMPTHTLFLLTNHKPGASAKDMAFWKRTFVIDFPYSFIPDPDPAKPQQKKRMEGLAAKIVAEEASGILAWLVKGCLAYQADGLSPPACVLDHTREYRRAEDTMADFVEECCDVGPEHSDSFKNLYQNFVTWWEGEAPGRRPMTKKKFGVALSADYEKIKTGGKMKYFGLAVKIISDA